ncbi:hypothetical protein Tco_1470341, partial [Tanacetum coccineum]
MIWKSNTNTSCRMDAREAGDMDSRSTRSAYFGMDEIVVELFKSHCDDLSLFSKWPILPVGNNHLLQLVENSYVIEDDGWSENMSSLLL